MWDSGDIPSGEHAKKDEVADGYLQKFVNGIIQMYHGTAQTSVSIIPLSLSAQKCLKYFYHHSDDTQNIDTTQSAWVAL